VGLTGFSTSPDSPKQVSLAEVVSSMDARGKVRTYFGCIALSRYRGVGAAGSIALIQTYKLFQPARNVRLVNAMTVFPAWLEALMQ